MKTTTPDLKWIDSGEGGQRPCGPYILDFISRYINFVAIGMVFTSAAFVTSMERFATRCCNVAKKLGAYHVLRTRPIVDTQSWRGFSDSRPCRSIHVRVSPTDLFESQQWRADSWLKQFQSDHSCVSELHHVCPSL